MKTRHNSILSLLFLFGLCPHVGAQTKNYVEKVELGNTTLEIKEMNANLNKLPPLDFSKAIRVEYDKSAVSEIKPILRFYNVKGVFVNSQTKEPIKGVKIYTIMADNFNSHKEHYYIMQIENATSNKKGKVAWEQLVFHNVRKDSILTYIFMHPNMENYGINVKFGLSGNVVNIDTLFMTPIQPNK